MNWLRKFLAVLAFGGAVTLAEAQPPREGPGRGGPEVKKEGPKGDRGERGGRGPEAPGKGPKGDRGPEGRPGPRPEGRPEANRVRELEAKLDMLRRATQEVEAELRMAREQAEPRRPESAPMPKAKGPEAPRGEMPKGPPFGPPPGFGGGFGGRGGFGGFPPFGGPPGFGGRPGQPPLPERDRPEARRPEPMPERRPEAGPPAMMREVMERLERIERELEVLRREIRRR